MQHIIMPVTFARPEDPRNQIEGLWLLVCWNGGIAIERSVHTTHAGAIQRYAAVVDAIVESVVNDN